MSRLLSTRWSHILDYENRLKQASLSGGVTTYTYDALGRRIQRSDSNATTSKFVYDGPDVVRDLNANLTTAADYVNGPGIDNKLRQTITATASYFIQDHLGTTRAFADASGAVNSSLTYDSFGNLTNGLPTTRYTFTGREIDGDNGLTYYRARWYDPQQGRFISEDPIGFKGGPNFYAYVGDNPTNYVDPFGRERLSTYTHTWPPPTPTSLPLAVQKSPCCNKTWTECYAQCIENNRLDNLLPILGSALPKGFLPPFRVPYSEQPLTTIPSVVAHYLPESLPRLATLLRTGGRVVSWVATPVLVFEGFYDLGLLGSCAELCHRNPCN